MPKPKERMAGYIRESDPSLADSNTIDSAARAVAEYGEREEYKYDRTQHEYKEAISAYMVPYMQRKRLLDLLAAAKRHEFDVVVIPEVRALSRRQVEVFVLYDMLQKCGIRLETIHEKFEDSAIGRYILATRAMIAEAERENTHMRTTRGRLHRLEGGAMNGHPKPAYGYVFVDTLREQKAHYAFNETIIYVDCTGKEWSEYTVCLYIFELLLSPKSIGYIVDTLNDLGIPTPHKGKLRKGEKTSENWQPATIHTIATNPVYKGEVYGNRYKKVGKTSIIRPREEWVRLPDCPAMITEETFMKIQKQFAANKVDALRNNKYPNDLGLLRSGYCRCGICGRSMHVEHPGGNNKLNGSTPTYRCRQREGKEFGTRNRHSVQIHVPLANSIARKKIIEILSCPMVVRTKIEQLREDNKPVIDIESVEATVNDLTQQIANLFELAKLADNKDTITRLGQMMNELEKKKAQAQAMLEVTTDDQEERDALEAEIAKFERWAEVVGPSLTNPEYVPSYEELRLAVRILGIVVTVYPTNGDYPHRTKTDVTIPDIMEKMGSIQADGGVF